MPDGQTLAHVACQTRNLEVLSLALEGGVGAGARAGGDMTALHYACEWGEGREGLPLLALFDMLIERYTIHRSILIDITLLFNGCSGLPFVTPELFVKSHVLI